MYQYLQYNTNCAVYDARCRLKTVFIKGGGGTNLHSWMRVKLIHRYLEKKVLLVPFYKNVQFFCTSFEVCNKL